MKACVLHGVKDLRYEDYPDPTLSSPDEVVVRVLRGGICGSDMHYYAHGNVGANAVVREPFIIGHEGIGRVEQAGANVRTAKVGDLVAIRPARPCFDCMYCDQGSYTFCENMRHLGSAATLPHTPGLFADKVLLHQAQVLAVGDSLKPEVGAFVEPLGVALGGVRRLGDLFGKTIAVMGAGPIGSLCVAAARMLGASEITAIDVRDEPLEYAKKMGAQTVCNSREEPDRINQWSEHKGHFDLVVEASGNKYALTTALAITRPEGIVSQVGVFAIGEQPTDFSAFMSKAIQWRGVFRFYDEFSVATRALEDGTIDPLPLLSAAFPVEQCVEALETALAPQTSKVQLIINQD